MAESKHRPVPRPPPPSAEEPEEEEESDEIEDAEFHVHVDEDGNCSRFNPGVPRADNGIVYDPKEDEPDEVILYNPKEKKSTITLRKPRESQHPHPNWLARKLGLTKTQFWTAKERYTRPEARFTIKQIFGIAAYLADRIDEGQFTDEASEHALNDLRGRLNAIGPHAEGEEENEEETGPVHGTARA